MIIDWQGKQYELDFAGLTLHQAEVIEKETGEPIEKWLDAVGEGTRKLQALRLLYWLMLAQNGEEAPVAAVDFPLLKFTQAFAAAAPPEPAPEAPDPTAGPSSPPASPSPPDPPTPGTSPSGTEEEAPATVS